jgi:hypothetical protein
MSEGVTIKEHDKTADRERELTEIAGRLAHEVDTRRRKGVGDKGRRVDREMASLGEMMAFESAYPDALRTWCAAFLSDADMERLPKTADEKLNFLWEYNDAKRDAADAPLRQRESGGIATHTKAENRKPEIRKVYLRLKNKNPGYCRNRLITATVEYFQGKYRDNPRECYGYGARTIEKATAGLSEIKKKGGAE